MLTRAIDPRSRQRPPTRMAPIHHAADKADVDALTTLLASGASAQAHDDYYGHTPLHKLFTWDKKNERGEDHIACFELLLRYGADVNARAHDGSTAPIT